MLRGIKTISQRRIKSPGSSTKATNAYRADSDKIGNFINECLKKTDTNSKAKEIYDCYVNGALIMVTASKTKAISLQK